MTFTEFRLLYPDAYADARGDLDMRPIMALLDFGDLLGVGQYIAKHFCERKAALEAELSEQLTWPDDEKLDDPRYGQAAAINK